MQCQQGAKLCSQLLVEILKLKAHTGVCEDKISGIDLSVKALKHTKFL